MYSKNQLVRPHTKKGFCKNCKKNVRLEMNGELTDRKTKK